MFFVACGIEYIQSFSDTQLLLGEQNIPTD
uniref:Uncharacterized protein n=1 Tax=Arundo donax TaxID=35708 RepID=A0A0A8YJG9_ARUDO